jgi:(E)-4-hydroxy-3-methylbut-2-enyl-diphosphate synthase
MGCIVNGPGEAREADIGIAGSRGRGILFRKGKIVKRLPEKKLLNALLDELRSYPR